MSDESDDEIEVIPYVKPPPIVIDIIESEDEEQVQEKKQKKKSKKRKKDKRRDQEHDNENDQDGNSGSQENDTSQNDCSTTTSLSSASSKQNEGGTRTTIDNGRVGVVQELVASHAEDSIRGQERVDNTSSTESRNVASNVSSNPISGPEERASSSNSIPQASLSEKNVSPSSRSEKCSNAQSKHVEVSQSVTGDVMVGTASLPGTRPNAPPINDPKIARPKERRARNGEGRAKPRVSAAQQRTNEEIVNFLTTIGIQMGPSAFDSPTKRKRQPRKRPEADGHAMIPGTSSSPGTNTLSSEPTATSASSLLVPLQDPLIPKTATAAFVSVTQEVSGCASKRSGSPGKTQRKRQAFVGDIFDFQISFSKDDLASVNTNIQSNIIIPGGPNVNQGNSFVALNSNQNQQQVPSVSSNMANMEAIIDAVARGDIGFLSPQLQPISEDMETEEASSTTGIQLPVSSSSEQTTKDSVELSSKKDNLVKEGESETICNDGGDDRPWKERCRDLLENIWQSNDAIPFRVPVNPKEFPDYYVKIDTPMDLQGVREELRGGKYRSPLDFHRDMNLIFKNSRKFDFGERSSVCDMGMRLQSKYESLLKPILKSYQLKLVQKNINKESSSSATQTLQATGNTSKEVVLNPLETRSNDDGRSSKTDDSVENSTTTAFEKSKEKDADKAVDSVSKICESHNSDNAKTTQPDTSPAVDLSKSSEEKTDAPSQKQLKQKRNESESEPSSSTSAVENSKENVDKAKSSKDPQRRDFQSPERKKRRTGDNCKNTTTSNTTASVAVSITSPAVPLMSINIAPNIDANAGQSWHVTPPALAPPNVGQSSSAVRERHNSGGSSRFRGNVFHALHALNPNEYHPGFPNTWTPHMREFYGENQREDFEIDDVWFQLPNNSRLWQAPADRMPPPKSKNRYVRCDRCKQYGHFKKDCTERWKPPVCHMCGREGHTCDHRANSHRNPRCPDARCLNCGFQLHQYSQLCTNCLLQRQPRRCDLCNVVGHRAQICPDNWRRYHSITTPEEFELTKQNPDQFPDYRVTNSDRDRDIYKHNRTLYCCNCGRRGHTYYFCEENRYNPYHRNKPFAIVEMDPITITKLQTTTSPEVSTTTVGGDIVVPYDAESSRDVVMNATVVPFNVESSRDVVMNPFVLYDTESSRAVVMNAAAERIIEHGQDDESFKIRIPNDKFADPSKKPPQSSNKSKEGSKQSKTSVSTEPVPCKGHQSCTNKLRGSQECVQVILMRQAHVKLMKAQENNQLQAFEKKHGVQISVINENYKVHISGENASKAEKDLYRFLWSRNEAAKNKKNVSEGSKAGTDDAKKNDNDSKAADDIPVFVIEDEDDEISVVEHFSTDQNQTQTVLSNPSVNASSVEKSRGSQESFTSDTPCNNPSIFTSFSTSGTSQSKPKPALVYESPLAGLSLGISEESSRSTSKNAEKDAAAGNSNPVFCMQKEGALYPNSRTALELGLGPGPSKNLPSNQTIGGMSKISNDRNESGERNAEAALDQSQSNPISTTPVPSSPSSFGDDDNDLVFICHNDKVKPKEPVAVDKTESDEDEIVELPKPPVHIEVITIDDEEENDAATSSSKRSTPSSPRDMTASGSKGSLASTSQGNAASTTSPASTGASRGSDKRQMTITLLESEWKLVTEEFSKPDNVFDQIAKDFDVDLAVSKDTSSVTVTQGSNKKRQMAKDNVVFWLECKSSKSAFKFLPRGYADLRKAQRFMMKSGMVPTHLLTPTSKSILQRVSPRSMRVIDKTQKFINITIDPSQIAQGKKRKRKQRGKGKKGKVNKSLPNTSNAHQVSPNKATPNAPSPNVPSTSTSSAVTGSNSASAPLFLPLSTSKSHHTWTPGFNNKDFRGAGGKISTPSTSKGSAGVRVHPYAPKQMKTNKSKNSRPPSTPTSSALADKARTNIAKRYYNSTDVDYQ